VEVVRLEVGPLMANAYLIRDARSGDGAIVDPGGDAPAIVRRCEAERLTPVYIVNTHAHADHIGANAALKERFPDAKLCIGAPDAERLADPIGNLTAAFGSAEESPAPDLRLEGAEELCFGSVVLEVLMTPGHTPGAISLLAREERPPQLFCGDLIFRRGLGRVDLPGGDLEAMKASIKEKVFSLPPGTVIWPGHGGRTTVGEERRNNPFLRGL
jgi:glyoxylase-like metal-dependent hydrolase (beta-lactamase superfamily II)